MRLEIVGAGGGGGGGGGSGTEARDSLHSTATAKILDIISEGPIVGLVNGLQSVFLDGTPVQNPDGSSNFSNYNIDTRPGTVDQAYMAGFPSVENEIPVSRPLDSANPAYVRQIENTQLTAVRVRFGVPMLQSTNKDTGDIGGHRVDYAIDLAEIGGAYTTVIQGAFDGKTTTLYERSCRVNLPKSSVGWLLRVRRITPSSNTQFILDQVNVEAITEIIDRKLRYPNSALIGMQFDAKSFASVPTRGYLVRGRIIDVPSNYNPMTRTYSGVWDGTFKQAYTNNPAWVFNDLAKHPRYGGGRYIDASALDKWTLYEIAQYCDVMVPDGKGGTEPRFTCNCVIQSQADAFKVLQDIAGIFRGQAYWGAGGVIATADMPSDPVYVYTNANVVDAKFTYTGTERKSRYTFAQVGWNDPANQYKAAVEPVQDDEGVARYGIVKASITAFGTTSQGQAHRLGLWTLVSSRVETQAVSFKVGLDGTLSMPGDVIAVADNKKAGRRMGGRIRSMTDTVVNLDKPVKAKPGDTLTVIMPNGVAQKRTIDSAVGGAVTVTQHYDAVGVKGAVWMLESDDLVAQLFRVTGIEENDENGQITYTISGVQHEPSKYDYIDTGAQLSKRPTTIVPPKVQAAPASVSVAVHYVVDQGISRPTMTIAWEQAANAVDYTVEWKKDSGEWIPAGTVGGQSTDVQGIYRGVYQARVRARNSMGVYSLPTLSEPTALEGKTGAPPVVVSLNASKEQIGQIEVDWAFPADHSADDTQRTEVWYSKNPTRDGSESKQGDYAYPTSRATLLGLTNGVSMFFWVRLVDRSGNVGAFYPEGVGVNGQSSANANLILDLLTDKLTREQFGQDLLSEMDALPDIAKQAQDAANTAHDAAQQASDAAAQVGGMADQIAANAAAISAETIARGKAIDSLDQKLVDLSSEVDGNTARLDEEATIRADADKSLAKGLRVLTAQLRPQMIGDDNDPFAGDEMYAGVYSEQEARVDGDEALATDIRGVAVEVDKSDKKLTAMVQDEMKARADGDSALADRLVTLESNVNGNISAQIKQEQQTRADADAALAKSVTTLSATVDANKASFTSQVESLAAADQAQVDSIAALKVQTGKDIVAGVATESKARADADGALSSRLDSVNATVGANKASVDAQVQALADADKAQVASIDALKVQTGKDIAAAVSTESKARADAVGALSSRVDSLTAQTAKDISAAVAGEASARTDAVGAVSKRVDTLTATAGDNNAALQNTLTSLANTDKAQASQISALQASVGTGGDVDTRINAAIKAQATVQAETDAAQSKRIDDVQAQAGKNAAAIQVNANAYADLKGQVNATYSVRVQALSNGRKVMAGWTLNADGSGDSSMVVAASNFMVVDPNGNGLMSPFAISGGQVVMSDAIVNNLRVDLALVHGRLQSTAIGSNGRPCVIIDMQSGELQFNGINNGSGWTEISPGRVIVYDGAGRPRVAMGVNI
ncbi:TipJ family phage tail tip protein [Burkholderia pseudomallei]|uniref:TipJ family phage tail tip protein n=4 Tax=Bacteria TaxID=2 RepID=UPI0009B5B6C7|nr:phage tail protein [Burkholderia pseudomallei]